MKSQVYFISVEDLDDIEAIKTKFGRLLEESNILNVFEKDDTVAVKMHFGEEGNTGYVKPEYVRMVCDIIKSQQAKPILTDTNTLYKGGRTTTEDHVKLAHKHGFTEEIAGAPIVIGEGSVDVKVESKFLKVAKIAPFFRTVDAIVGIAHFKGHLITGFGGILKNIGMGCASREGKLLQHSDLAPFVKIEKCSACGACIEACPVDAISMKNEAAFVNKHKCIGCASCIAACPESAIDLDWESGAPIIQERMVDHARAVLTEKEKKMVFINFAIKITKECDCIAKDDPRICPDVGILASKDSVAIDKAALDVIIKTCGKDIFQEVHPKRDGLKQLFYASRMGLGTIEYELINLSY